MISYVDILARPVIEEYPMLYVNYVKDKKYVEEFSPIHFLELSMDYEEHIKQWLLKVEDFSQLEGVRIM